MSSIKRDRSDYYTILNHVHEIVCEEIVSIADQIIGTTKKLKGTSSTGINMSESDPIVSVSILTATKTNME